MDSSAGRFTAVLVAGAFLVPAGLSAQGHRTHHPEQSEARSTGGMMEGGMMEGGMMRSGMMGPPSGMMGHQQGMMSRRMGMGMMQPGPRMLLRQREALDLSGEQIEQIERLQARADELRSSHRSAMASMRDEIRAFRTSDDPDLERYESLLREQADHRVDMRMEALEIHRDALDVLTDEQRSNVRYGMRMMRSMHRGGAMSSGMAGEGSGMMDMMEGMGQPQMMGMMMRMHRQMHGQDCPMAPSPGTDES